MEIEELNKVYESTCNRYVQIFCEKQDMSFEGWVGNQIGGVVCCSDMYFNIDDIVTDVNLKQPKGQIVDWYYDNIGNPKKSINYFSYTKGLRIADIH